MGGVGKMSESCFQAQPTIQSQIFFSLCKLGDSTHFPWHKFWGQHSHHDLSQKGRTYILMLT